MGFQRGFRSVFKVGQDGVPPLQGKGIDRNGCTCERMIFHEKEWYRVRIILSSLLEEKR